MKQSDRIASLKWTDEGIKPSRPKKEKHTYYYTIKVPYINEKFTRVTKKIIKQSNINARVVVTSGNPNSVTPIIVHFVKMKFHVRPLTMYTSSHVTIAPILTKIKIKYI